MPHAEGANIRGTYDDIRCHVLHGAKNSEKLMSKAGFTSVTFRQRNLFPSLLMMYFMPHWLEDLEMLGGPYHLASNTSTTLMNLFTFSPNNKLGRILSWA